MHSLAEYGIWNTMFISNTVTMFFAIGYFLVMIPPLLREAEQQHRSATQKAASQEEHGSLA
jgi:hypothetical protein